MHADEVDGAVVAGGEEGTEPREAHGGRPGVCHGGRAEIHFGFHEFAGLHELIPGDGGGGRGDAGAACAVSRGVRCQ